MSDVRAWEGCQVTLLVPHPQRLAILARDDTTARVSATSGLVLPTVVLPSAEPLLAEILDLVEVVDTHTTAVLRQVITSGGVPDNREPHTDGEVSLVVEFDAGTTEAPEGWTWQDLDSDTITRLEPETAQATVGAWARERVEGWSPLRPAWSHPGWLPRAKAWMVAQMAADGRPAVDAPRQHQLWSMSVVLRCASADGDVYFKCSPEVFRHEAVVTRALAQRTPDLLPEVIAVDPDQGWMLMRDLGAAELGDQDESLWHQGLEAHAAVQQSWLRRTDDLLGLGLPIRSLTDLAGRVEESADDDVLMGRASPDLRGRWRRAAPALAESCRRLDQMGPGPTLVHGDLHPWNVVRGSGGTRVFDWTDAAISHPFIDLATYVFRTRDGAVRRHLVDRYINAWSGSGPQELAKKAAALALVVGALYQVQTYRSLLPALKDHGADDDMAEADLDWMNRSLTRHHQGLESPL